MKVKELAKQFGSGNCALPSSPVDFEKQRKRLSLEKAPIAPSATSPGRPENDHDGFSYQDQLLRERRLESQQENEKRQQARKSLETFRGTGQVSKLEEAAQAVTKRRMSDRRVLLETQRDNASFKGLVSKDPIAKVEAKQAVEQPVGQAGRSEEPATIVEKQPEGVLCGASEQAQESKCQIIPKASGGPGWKTYTLCGVLVVLLVGRLLRKRIVKYTK
mmetsp:Transcript_4777/g.7205  ORF Transcript_4777/g.7205 Transcript_4777/m.7205 type:complete len:218 (-) Transcript_4777:4195-4848(-)|eukprot:CAMPEP_0203752072 /NCGR_PEP_ID=MMETSP0098-20131031/6044_1 /ASSEMBLY_ACC=CAM_ASM_000208 /TAXON_ID=96639 /ORGANISM=" , Strain NY0313808BC1" /LENGTH=217 /DNA_ID=CAMNT_0050642071 /DNA_START=2022 /DNA_END=2675 /DNA_ORIENTATION=-